MEESPTSADNTGEQARPRLASGKYRMVIPLVLAAMMTVLIVSSLAASDATSQQIPAPEQYVPGNDTGGLGSPPATSQSTWLIVGGVIVVVAASIIAYAWATKSFPSQRKKS